MNGLDRRIREAFQRELDRSPADADFVREAAARVRSSRSGSGAPRLATSLAIGLVLLTVAVLLYPTVVRMLGSARPPSTNSVPAATPAATPGELPPGRSAAAAAYDSGRHELVVFGGRQGELRPLSDTWLWDGRAWREAHPRHSPPPSDAGAMAYDPVRRQVVLFGVGGGQTWTWDGGDWTQRFPGGSPPASGAPALAYDPALGRVVAVSGETWAWDGANWTDLATPHVPPVCTLGWSPAQRSLLCLSGGPLSARQQWRFDGRDWSELPLAVPADGWFFYGTAAYDEGRDGWIAVESSQARAVAPTPFTNAVRGGTWMRVYTGPGPFAVGVATVYDPAGGRLLAFGGLGPDGRYLADLWAWDGSRWTQLS